MERKKMLFIYNPKAGKTQIRSKLMDLIDLFVKAGFEVTAYPTQSRGDAVSRMSGQELDYDAVVCSGGDGTLDEVVTGLMKSGRRIPIGYIPSGSTNDFADSLSLPKNMLKAAEVITKGHKKAYDIGSFNNDTFVYIAAFGIFTDVSYGTDQKMKNVLGHMAYILEGVKRLSSIRSYPLKVTCEDVVIEDEFIFGMVTNSVSVGGFKSITGKNVCLDDGCFEVTLIKKPKNPLELNSIMGALVIAEMDTKYMYTFEAGRLKIESEEPVAWTLDGEFGGNHEKVIITNNKQAVEIFTKE